MNLLVFPLLVFASLLPAIFLAFLMRIPSIHQLAQRNRFTRILVVAVVGLLCLSIYFVILNWGMAWVVYSIGEFYFNTIFGLVPGITPVNLGQFHWATVNEIALRQIAAAGQDPMCLSGNVTACKLADMASKLSSPSEAWSLILQMALLATLINVALSWKATSNPPTSPKTE